MTTPAPAVRPQSQSTVAVPMAAPAPSGRLAVLSAAAMGALAIPLPILPDRIVTRLRGALAHDTATRHGISLTTDAREILANVDSEQNAARALGRKAAEAIGLAILKRGLGPLGALTNLARALEVFAFGHLFDRYITQARRSGAVRIHAEEARKIRETIDRAFLHAFSPMLRPTPITLPETIEDLRDEFTRWIDTAILTGASLPSYVERRLEAAFDEVVKHDG
ncbi:hypothetical protein [Polyangium sp. y55x31]|uniref:hypothetical protein n=1 Tax=Polyangium sp. y55x31 TaxID=3042688 RepID=UPI00248287D9|nr:hypothetical protein [Polyangium sp. y55x31]MDI1477202.1 hypothetical protein [Polyangium sp. y55x31]